MLRTEVECETFNPTLRERVLRKSRLSEVKYVRLHTGSGNGYKLANLRYIFPVVHIHLRGVVHISFRRHPLLEL
jgi:hypothetical protein